MDWLPGFLERHRARFDPFDWPTPDSGDYVDCLLDWQAAFAAKGVTEDEATRASRRLTFNPPKYRREHIPAMLATVASLRAERPPSVHKFVSPDAAKDAAWEGMAVANWAARDESERDYWRALVVARMPMFRGLPRVTDMMAAGWCYDPATVVGGTEFLPGDPLDPSMVA
jgi:hypothetical protein